MVPAISGGCVSGLSHPNPGTSLGTAPVVPAQVCAQFPKRSGTATSVNIGPAKVSSRHASMQQPQLQMQRPLQPVPMPVPVVTVPMMITSTPVPSSSSTAPACIPAATAPASAVLWRLAESTTVTGRCTPNMYWATESRCPSGEGVVVYSTDDRPEFAYEAFNLGRDFGPLDIGRTVMYCRWVDALCAAHATSRALVHVTSDFSAEHRANSVTLCAAYLVLALGRDAEEACRPFANEHIASFVDCRGEASAGSAIGDEAEPEFELSILDVLRGLQIARDVGWIDYQTYPAEEHCALLRPENGDMSWLLPGTAIAFASPWAASLDMDGLPVCTPAMLSRYFQQNGVRTVIQCNEPEKEEEGERRRLLCYQPCDFEQQGLMHVKLAFEDGGCPSVEIVVRFLEVVESTHGGVAVHCRSGLGRTATLIGVYAIQNLGFSARDFIGWARLMRPGTVHGSQQQYLCNLEPHLQGVAQPLHALGKRDQLMLLPRRELRFHALDHGIPADATRAASAVSIVDQILAVQGTSAANVQQSLPAPSAALRAPDPAQFRSMTGRAGSSVSMSPGLEVPPSLESPNAASSGYPTDGSHNLDSMNGLNAAIASLNRGNSTCRSVEIGGTSERNEWDEVLRYLGLLMAVQERSAPSWGGVRSFVEKLKELSQVNTPLLLKELCSPSLSESELTAAHEVVAGVMQTACKIERVERDLADAHLEVRNMQRDCEGLRFTLSMEREAGLTQGRRLKEHGETLDNDLQKQEEKLQKATEEVEFLRERALFHDASQRCKVARVDTLQREYAEVKLAALSDRARLHEQQERLEAATKELARCHKEASQDDTRRSIERLRDEFQKAVQQARLNLPSMT